MSYKKLKEEIIIDGWRITTNNPAITKNKKLCKDLVKEKNKK